MQRHILMSRGILGSSALAEAVKDMIKKTDRVTVVNLSFFPFHLPDKESYGAYYHKGSEYYEKIVNAFAPYGIPESSITWIDHYNDTTGTALKKVNEADILYFPGGAPDLLMSRMEHLGIVEAVNRHDGLVIGSSAGAMVQFKTFHVTPDNEYRTFVVHTGLDMIGNFAVEVHYRRRKVQKKAMRRIWKKTRKDIYVIPDDGAVIVCDGVIRCVGTARKHYGRQGTLKKERRNRR